MNQLQEVRNSIEIIQNNCRKNHLFFIDLLDYVTIYVEFESVCENNNILIPNKIKSERQKIWKHRIQDKILLIKLIILSNLFEKLLRGVK
jgi:hypothetical protein